MFHLVIHRGASKSNLNLRRHKKKFRSTKNSMKLLKLLKDKC